MNTDFDNPHESTPTSPNYVDAGFEVPADVPYVYYQIDLGGGGSVDPGDGNCDPRPTAGMIYPRRLPVAGR
jgi:hypothetical protein